MYFEVLLRGSKNKKNIIKAQVSVKKTDDRVGKMVRELALYKCSRVQFPLLASYVDRVCWFSTLL